jgi:hypothetical protein
MQLDPPLLPLSQEPISPGSMMKQMTPIIQTEMESYFEKKNFAATQRESIMWKRTEDHVAQSIGTAMQLMKLEFELKITAMKDEMKKNFEMQMKEKCERDSNDLKSELKQRDETIANLKLELTETKTKLDNVKKELENGQLKLDVEELKRSRVMEEKKDEVPLESRPSLNLPTNSLANQRKKDAAAAASAPSAPADPAAARPAAPVPPHPAAPAAAAKASPRSYKHAVRIVSDPVPAAPRSEPKERRTLVIRGAATCSQFSQRATSIKQLRQYLTEGTNVIEKDTFDKIENIEFVRLSTLLPDGKSYDDSTSFIKVEMHSEFWARDVLRRKRDVHSWDVLTKDKVFISEFMTREQLNQQRKKNEQRRNQRKANSDSASNSSAINSRD